MREIKFRAWDKERNEMMDANYFGIDEYITPEGSVVEKETHSGIGFSDMYMVDISDKRILMQYTGLKDKNGREIYEGDILKCKTDGGEMLTEVVWDDFGWCEKLIKSPRNHYRDYFPFRTGVEINLHSEVIGNIHENPELLGDS